jgi:tetratricopeptide (TPR) repeat protein
LSLVLPLLLHAPAALADGDATARAKDRFAAGAQAYREARYKDAIDLFLQANQIDPHADLIFNVGQAYEKLGDVANALRSYREYLRLDPGARDRATVETSIKNLEARLRERGVQQVSIFSTPAGATVILDGKSAGQTPWTGEIAPGRHVAVLRATGYPDIAKEFVLLAERSMDLDVALALGASGSAAIALAGKPPEATKPADVPPPVEPPKPRVAPWTIATLGVGVAGLATALGLEVARANAASSAQANVTQIGYQSALDNMTSLQTGARVMVGVGAAVTVAGGVLLVFDLRRPAAPPVKAGLGCFMGACGAIASGRF